MNGSLVFKIKDLRYLAVKLEEAADNMKDNGEDWFKEDIRSATAAAAFLREYADELDKRT